MSLATYDVSTTPERRVGSQPAESMTFYSHLARDRYIREQRAYGWEVFLSHMGTNAQGVELYQISRRKL